LRPGVLDDLGLAAAIEWQVKEFASITGIQCHVSVPQEDLPVAAARLTAIFRILQEALTNVARHAQARMVRATLAQQNGNLVLVVQDDGKGISESDVESSRGSLGLLGMKERAEACGGELEIWGDPGKGTTLALHIPLAEPRQQGGNDADPAGR
jgi:signal transduction histidine kinase